MMRAVNERLDHVPGEVLVKFRAGTDAAAQSSIMALAPAPIGGRRTRWVGDLAVVSTDRRGAGGGGRRPAWPASRKSSTRSRTTSCG